MVAQSVTGHKNPRGKKSRADEPRQTVITRLLGFTRALAALLVVAVAGSAVAQEVARGPVTNLPLPRYVSMKASEGNVRRGPSLSHRIDWVFKRRDMPLQITAEHGHWRRVQDRDGQGGWVHYALLSGARTVLVEQDMLTIHARPETAAAVVAAFENGVVARLGKCEPEWCRVSSGGFRGWARKSALWGVAPDELRD
ncbi:MAG: aspartyl-trna synthetase [Aestuariivita sp.]|nr:aspartyl-trna synthetase [Aestuariivita sp.]